MTQTSLATARAAGARQTRPLERMIAARGQLQAALDAKRFRERVVGSAVTLEGAPDATGGWWIAVLPPDEQTLQLATTLSNLLDQIEADFRAIRPTAAEDLEIRLSKATLANAQQRYNDALSLVTEADSRAAAASGATRSMGVLQVRADALCGAEKWQAALGLYERLHESRPDPAATLSAAKCSLHLGRFADARKRFNELIAYYQKEQPGQGTNEQVQRQANLLRSLTGRGVCCQLLGDLGEAMIDHIVAIQRYQTLITRQGHRELRNELATTGLSLAVTMERTGGVIEAALHYEQANALQAQLWSEGNAEPLEEFRRGVAMYDRFASSQNVKRLDKLAALYGQLDGARKLDSRAAELKAQGDKLWASIFPADADKAVALFAQAADAYTKAIDLYTQLVEQHGRSELAGELAASLTDRGDVRNRTLAEPETADFDKAEHILAPLVEQGRSDGTELARVYGLRGTAWERGARLSGASDGYNRAIADYDKAINLYTGLTERKDNSFLDERFARLLIARGHLRADQRELAEQDFRKAAELAVRIRRRGDARYQQGELAAAVRDYDLVIDLGELAERDGPQPIAQLGFATHFVRARARHRLGKLREAVEDYNMAVTMFTALTNQGRSDLSVNLAGTLHHRASALEELDELAKAVEDYGKAIDMRTQLVEQDAGSERVGELAESLNNLAWLHATCANSQFRDGAKAVELAARACELTKWNDWAHLDTLAAASAEAGDFAAAVKWQAKALDFSPESLHAEMRDRLQMYQSRRPYHAKANGG